MLEFSTERTGLKTHFKVSRLCSGFSLVAVITVELIMEWHHQHMILKLLHLRKLQTRRCHVLVEQGSKNCFQGSCIGKRKTHKIS